MFSQSPAIIWDGYGIESPYSGIGRHASSLMEALHQQSKYPLILQYGSRNESRLLSPWRISPALNSIKLLHSWQLFRDSSWLEQISSNLSRSQKLIFHGLSNFNIPLNAAQKNFRRVLTVHDLIPLLAKQQVSFSLSQQFKYLLPKALRAADAVIAVSQWTASTVLEAFPWVADKLVVIPNGFQQYSDLMAYVPRETSHTQFLSVSRFEPYKRLDLLAKIITRSPSTMKFTVISDTRGSALLSKEAAGPLGEGRLQIYQGLSDREIQECFVESDALIHTSQFEGFCLPAAEALAVGKPVIFQKGSGIDEVVGDCGIGIDSGQSVDDWLDIMKSKLWYRDSGKIKEWIEQQLSWQKVADMTLRVYNGDQAPEQ